MDKVGIGIIGTGFARKVQIPAFAVCEGARIVSISSGHYENARDAAAEFGAEHFTDDWRETVSHPDVDLVCLRSPRLNALSSLILPNRAGGHGNSGARREVAASAGGVHQNHAQQGRCLADLLRVVHSIRRSMATQ